MNFSYNQIHSVIFITFESKCFDSRHLRPDQESNLEIRKETGFRDQRSAIVPSGPFNNYLKKVFLIIRTISSKIVFISNYICFITKPQLNFCNPQDFITIINYSMNCLFWNMNFLSWK